MSWQSVSSPNCYSRCAGAGTHDFFADIIINYTGYKPSGGSNLTWPRRDRASRYENDDAVHNAGITCPGTVSGAGSG